MANMVGFYPPETVTGISYNWDVSPNSNPNRELGNDIQKLQLQNKRSFIRIRQDLLRLKRRLATGGNQRRVGPPTQN